MIEPFRPAVDDVVASMLPVQDISLSEVRSALVRAASRQFLNDGRTIPAAFEAFAQDVGMYMEGDIRTLSVPSWQGI